MKKKIICLSAVLLGALVIAGCEKEGGKSQTIELPEGQLHLGSQWVDGQLWVESFDPATRACSFRSCRQSATGGEQNRDIHQLPHRFGWACDAPDDG